MEETQASQNPVQEPGQTADQPSVETVLDAAAVDAAAVGAALADAEARVAALQEEFLRAKA